MWIVCDMSCFILFNVTENFIIVFYLQIVVGCSAPEKHVDGQVHVQYSVDFGVSWKYLVPQCLPANPRCGGQVSQPSVFFPAEDWRRAVYPLTDSLSEK